jgi:basic amino acid/polyamine antiporter, APA family
MTDAAAPVERSGERGLARVIGTWGLAAGIVNVTIGGGIFRLPAGVAAAVGPAAPLAYLACTLAMGLIVLCFADAGSRVSMTGGPYAYVETAFGPFVGFVCGALLWVGITLALSAV